MVRLAPLRRDLSPWHSAPVSSPGPLRPSSALFGLVTVFDCELFGLSSPIACSCGCIVSHIFSGADADTATQVGGSGVAMKSFRQRYLVDYVLQGV